MKASVVATFVGATVLTAMAGQSSARVSRGFWYRVLRKPKLQPPPAVFGPVWSLLYTLTTLSGLSLHRARASPSRTAALGLYGAQQAFNALWTPLFFGARKPKWALVDLGLLLGSLTAYTIASAKADKRAALLMLPQLAWVSFAGYLNGAIVTKNPRLLVD